METSLFSSLNANADLRNEMREMLALNRAVREDKVALIPPIASTAAVFGALGMSTSMLVQSGWLSSLWSKVWMPLAVGVVSSVATWYAVSPGSMNSSEQGTSVTSTTSQSTSAASPNSAQNSAANSTSNTARASQESSSSTLAELRSTAPASQRQSSGFLNGAARVQHDTVYVTRKIYIDRPVLAGSPASPGTRNGKNAMNTVPAAESRNMMVDKQTIGTNAAQNSSAEKFNDRTAIARPSASANGPVADNIENVPVPSTSFAALTLRKLHPDVLKQQSDAVNASAAPDATLYEMPVFKPGFQAYVRALGGRSLVDVSVVADNTATLNNLAVGVRRSFNEYFSAGLELGSESIAMKFSGIVDGSVKRYEANPALTWGSVFGQVNLFPSMWNSGWQPFIQLNLGGTNYGVLSKAQF